MVAAIAYRSPAVCAWRAELWATLTLAAPLAATQLAQIAITTTDVLMMGWIGPEALAAGSLGAHLFFVLHLFGLGVALATSPLMAQAIGARRHRVREVRRSVRQGFWATTAIGLPCCAILWQTESILIAFGQGPVHAALAQDYARAMIAGFLPALWFVVMRCFVTAIGRPRPALIVMIVGVAANAFGCWVMMFGKLGAPALGLVGAGISSSLTNILLCGLLLMVVLRDRRMRRYHLLGRLWRPDWRRLGEIFRVGLPIGGSFLFEVMLFAFAVLMMGWIGTAELAAHQIAVQVCSITFMVPLGISQAATVRVGLALGANDSKAIGHAGQAAMLLGVGFMATMAVILWTVPYPIIGLFLDLTVPANGTVAAMAAGFLAVAAVFQIADALQVVGGGALRGLKDTRMPMMIVAIGYWGVGLPVALLLGFQLGWGGFGIWIGLAVGLIAVAVQVVWRFVARGRLGLLPRAGLVPP